MGYEFNPQHIFYCAEYINNKRIDLEVIYYYVIDDDEPPLVEVVYIVGTDTGDNITDTITPEETLSIIKQVINYENFIRNDRGSMDL